MQFALFARMMRTVSVLLLATAALGGSKIDKIKMENYKFVCSAFPQRFDEVVGGDERIANGTDAPLGKYPSVVALYRYDYQYCSGTILNEYWVLTSAICVNG
jgi:hypothetical protein